MAAQGVGFWTEERVEELRRRWRAGEKVRVIAKALGNTEDAISSKAAAIGLPRRQRGHKRGAGESPTLTGQRDLGPPIDESNKAMKPETAAQSLIWANIQFTDHPAAARPEGRLRGLSMDSTRSMVGCAAALSAAN